MGANECPVFSTEFCASVLPFVSRGHRISGLMSLGVKWTERPSLCLKNYVIQSIFSKNVMFFQTTGTVFRKPSAIFKMDSKESSYSSGSSVTPSSSAPAEQPVTGKEKDPNNWGNCQQSLSYHGNLLKKLRLPTEDKPYSCKKCERSFSQKEHLAFHTRIHEGSRHYSCSECEKNLSGKTSVYSL
ncbi:hypothetical protein NDU88_001670 [Pleurodeles waltl]|uniref:C2H2-type domain-containing protein n=1 Tax=Pleurodeles waltl TaxID=8319 RepID=A0AAV7SAR2_PLEWA|nr:hypothetical protein NDU88_001670 [Pleurodeles waltl]